MSTRAERMKRQRAARIAAGICTVCQSPREEGMHWVCLDCARIRRIKSRARYRTIHGIPLDAPHNPRGLRGTTCTP